jgi:hypothetical protein
MSTNAAIGLWHSVCGSGPRVERPAYRRTVRR